ncbi:hypothetical protein GCM10009347_41640 [Shewanella algicola]|uniref:Uncharacterized protein n=1 Tax=Shewanella algicola TaxID=640633 RepID=A0A9X1ZIT3_9GAMM|nr:hypothetical protein [Shewanella algicola]MCL1107758.1 hypothetical protein [Shewanella algicola]GGP72654.1 hypothetical protein GCM10009347_41640 [Shewanella algicola]
MNEIQMTFYSLLNLFDRSLWVKLLSELERLFGQKLSHLDVNDPLRKKVSDLETAADYICSIGKEESSRRLFGKFGKSKIELSISIFKEAAPFPNSLSIYFPEKVIGDKEGLCMLRNAFEESNRCLKSFYSICDSMDTIASKRKATGYAVDLQAELIGVFWLTYFGKAYVDYFEESKFLDIPSRRIEGLDGSMMDLGESPISIAVARYQVEALLGKESFVDPSLGYDKPVGKNALRFDQLR